MLILILLRSRLIGFLLFGSVLLSGTAWADTGFTVHYIGQYWDNRLFTADLKARKVREWVTLDWVLNYTFNFPATAGPNEVPGSAKETGQNKKTRAGKNSDVLPVSTAEYHSCGWRAWLNNTTVTLGLNNVFDEQPPFLAASFENGYDESATNLKGRTWYVALKKLF